MSKKTSLITLRARTLLRLVLIWARRSRLAVSLNILQKVIRKLVHSDGSRRALAYGDHEFSFGDTPIIHVKMRRPSSALRFKMPCVRPQVDSDYEVEDDEASEECIHVQSTCIEIEEGCDEGIDVRAEEFIARFYEQMKLQRQMSYLEHNG